MNKAQAVDGEVIRSEFPETIIFPKEKHSGRRRHIFIFLDGTWNEERSSSGLATPTNVLRMFQEINHKTSKEATLSSHRDDSDDLIAHYYRGIGSRQDNNVVSHKWFGFSGKDEERIRDSAFAELYGDCQDSNDLIYILGFSRGAASARLLARDICNNGFPPKLKVDRKHFPNLLTGQIEARVTKVESLGDKRTDNCPKVVFLGCWDTVDAFVLPSRFPKKGWKDATIRGIKKLMVPSLWGTERFNADENKIPEGIKMAVHCVAIDETRNAFLPTLMPNEFKNVEEVWFPGVHADVGGGYDDNMLANGPYEFMKSRLLAATGMEEKVLFKSKELIKDEEEAETLLRSREQQSTPSGFCFHFHGLNSGVSRVKDLLGFGTDIRKIQVLETKGEKDKTITLPKIHDSLFSIMKSDMVFAADPQNRRTWTITYDPYNVRELDEKFEPLSDKIEKQTATLNMSISKRAKGRVAGRF